MRYKHLEGLEFDMDRQNCYQLVRRFYRDNYGIELTDYACPTNWWAHGMNLIADLSEQEGFTIVNSHPRDYRPGDVIVMAIQSSTGNHCAVLLDNGQILHHLVGQRSCVTPYGGMFRNTTVGVYRHNEVPSDQPTDVLVDIRTVVPPHVARRMAQLEEARRPAPPETEAGT